MWSTVAMSGTLEKRGELLAIADLEPLRSVAQ
jgi:hypothetical protein